MIYGSLTYRQVATEYACTANWLAQTEQSKHENAYFKAFIVDSMSGLVRNEAVYVFTQEQVRAVAVRCKAKSIAIVILQDDGCFRIERVLK